MFKNINYNLKKVMKKFFLSLLCLGFVITSCNNDDDTVIEEEVVETPEEEVPVVVDIEVQNFFWQTLNLYYFWQGDVPDLADDRFDTQTAYEEYLTENSEPIDFLFLDGWKDLYLPLFQMLEPLFHSETIIYADNMDMSGTKPYAEYVLGKEIYHTKIVDDRKGFLSKVA